MTAAQFLSVMQARWRLAATVLLLCILVSLALSLLLPKQYTATASVVVDVKSTDPIVGSTSPAMMAPSYMATQVDIMESERVAQIGRAHV